MIGYDHWKTTEPPQWEDYDICCGEPVPVGELCPTCAAPLIGDNLTGHTGEQHESQERHPQVSRSDGRHIHR